MLSCQHVANPPDVAGQHGIALLAEQCFDGVEALRTAPGALHSCSQAVSLSFSLARRREAACVVQPLNGVACIQAATHRLTFNLNNPSLLIRAQP